MLDRFNRKLNYLRISVTDRCNLRCAYCMPEDGLPHLRHEDILTFEEIQKIVELSVNLGIDKVRLTGGEPLVRKGIVELVRMIAQIPGVKDFAMTTNGTLLEEFAQPLSDAGLHRVNVSLDTMDSEKFREVTRGGDINKVLQGIEKAKLVGLNPVKVNCVIKSSSNEADALQVKAYCNKNNLQVRFIKQMDLETGNFGVVEGGSGGDCENCNRLRLTSDGKIKPCLFSDLEFDVREFGILKAFELALEVKPKQGSCSFANKFSNIGG